MAENPLASVADLGAALTGADPPLLLDVRWSLGGPPGVDEYRRGHIGGAFFVDLPTDLAGPPGGGRGRHPLPDALAFEAAMRRCGVSRDRATVVYDAGGGMSAARAWWLLRYFGHRDVRLLDGGLAAWSSAGMKVDADEPRTA